MSLIIDNHFYSDLFEKKQVNCHNDLYLALFDTIWQCPENFKSFLSSTDSSLKIEYAKRIYENFTLVNNLFLPPFTILNVLDEQNQNYSSDSENYVPQDHFIHNIHLYILGIYIFFNHQLLNEKLTSVNTNEDLYHNIKDFILKWQVFSLFHDAGYFFEDSTFTNKDLSKYKHIIYHNLHHIVTKYLTKIITLKALAEMSNTKLGLHLLKYDLGSWYDINDKRVPNNKAQDIIKRFSEAIYISEIKSDEDIQQIIPLLHNQEYLVAVYDLYGNCVSIITKKDHNITNYFCKQKSIKENLLINNIVKTCNHQYVFKYYFLNIKDNDFWSNIIDNYLVIDNVCEQLPKDIVNYLSVNSYSVRDLFFKINSWIVSSLPLSPVAEQTLFDLNYSKCIKKSIIENIQSTVANILEDQDFNDKEYISSFLLQLKNAISTKDQRELITNKVWDDTDEIYNEQYGTTHNFIDFYKQLIYTLYNSTDAHNSSKALNFFDFDNIKSTPFTHDYRNPNHTKLYNMVSSMASCLNIKMDSILKYQPSYALFDHGVISASLLFQISAFNCDIENFSRNQLNIPLIWSTSYTKDDEYIKFCAETIFSVLLHNIYTKKSCPTYGIEYSHDIDKNPFSYFCAFCDTIQKWGRPKKVDLARTHMPNIHFLEDEFDINVSNNTIHIKCLEKNIESIKKTLYDSESFLPGVSIFIKTILY